MFFHQSISLISRKSASTHIHKKLRYSFDPSHGNIRLVDDFRSYSSNPGQIFKKLHRPHKLKKLIFDFDRAPSDPKDIKHIYTEILKKFCYIEILKINLNVPKTSIDEFFEILIKALRRYRNLRILEIAIPSSFEDEGREHYMKELIKVIHKSAPGLEELKLTWIMDKGWSVDLRLLTELPSLEKWGVKRLRNLKSLILHLPKSVFFNRQTNTLDFSALKRFEKLRCLDIVIYPKLAEKDELNTGLTFDPNKMFPKLKQFKWSIESPYFSNARGMEAIGPEIALRLKYLTDIGLKYHKCSLREEEMEVFNKCFNFLQTDVNRLSLRFPGGKLTGEGAKILFSILSAPKLRTIHTLSLEFVFSKGINNGFLANLAKAISQNMKGLKCLNLYFSPYNQYYSAKSPSLTENLMTFLGFDGISDKGIKNIGAIFSKECQCLEFLYLTFYGYSQISSDGVRSLCESLRKMKSLKRVWLKFRLCSGMSETKQEDMSEKLEQYQEFKIDYI